MDPNNKAESTLENMLENNTSKDCQIHSYGIRDFNNVETADRKLILNNHLEFWTHDIALSNDSDYFSYIFGRLNQSDLNNSINLSLINTTETEDYKQTSITIPHEELFLDILLWIYTKDNKKLKKAGKTFQPFLSLISLGIFLKMKEDFFEILLSDLKFEWKHDAFSHPLWSRTIFTFPILERIVKQMPGESYLKIVALLSWLKVINASTKEVLISKEIIDEVMMSHDLFYVRNFIKSNQLMLGLTMLDIQKLSNAFGMYMSALDTFGLVSSYIIGNKIQCLICKQMYTSMLEVAMDSECKNRAIGDDGKEGRVMYHPRCVVRNEKCQCGHEGCKRRVNNKNEYPCCHKRMENSGNSTFSSTMNGTIKDSLGCQHGDGRHMLVFV